MLMTTKDYDPRVREALSRVPEGNWKEFAAFAGPRLETLHGWDKVVLLGDASHPLSGAVQLSLGGQCSTNNRYQVHLDLAPPLR